MNRTTEIIEYLAKSDTPDELVLVPNAPPVSRSGGTLRVALSTLFDAQDLNDTLAAFRTRALATSTDTSVGRSGTFSFGIRDVGRFRVNYATQRGSRIMSIVMVPGTIPEPEWLCEDSAIAEQVLDLLRSGKPGLLTVCGPSAISNAIFVYAMINRLNAKDRKVIFIIERALTFLIKHENSIIVQCELGSDVSTMSEGVAGASLFEPDVLFVGDVKPQDKLPEIARCIENGSLAVISSVMLNEQNLMKDHYPHLRHGDAKADFVSGAFHVTPGADGRLTVVYHHAISEAL